MGRLLTLVLAGCPLGEAGARLSEGRQELLLGRHHLDLLLSLDVVVAQQVQQAVHQQHRELVLQLVAQLG